MSHYLLANKDIYVYIIYIYIYIYYFIQIDTMYAYQPIAYQQNETNSFLAESEFFQVSEIEIFQINNSESS